MNSEAQLGLSQLRFIIMQTVTSYSIELINHGCFCSWGIADELNEEQAELEENKSSLERHYQLLFLIPPDFEEVTGYPARAIGVHIDHTNDCPVWTRHYSRFN